MVPTEFELAGQVTAKCPCCSNTMAAVIFGIPRSSIPVRCKYTKITAAVIFGLVQICLGSKDACFPDIPTEGLQDFEEAGRGVEEEPSITVHTTS